MTSPRPPRGSGRGRAVAAARARFETQGFEATSIDEVLADSSLSRGALYHHFAGKAELFVAVLEAVEQEILERVLERAGQAPSPAAAIRTGLEAFLREARHPGVRQIVFIDAPGVLGWPALRELDQRFAFGAMLSACQAAVDAGEFALEPDLVTPTAHALLAALVELGLYVAAADDPDDAEHRARRTLARIIAGLTTS